MENEITKQLEEFGYYHVTDGVFIQSSVGLKMDEAEWPSEFRKDWSDYEWWLITDDGHAVGYDSLDEVIAASREFSK